MNKRVLYGILVLAMCVNLALAILIESEKYAKERDNNLLGSCFVGEGGCATVQTSYFAKTLGIANPFYGLIFFTLWAFLFAGMSLTKISLRRKLTRLKNLHRFLAVSMIFGAVFSIWLLYVQFFILRSVCIYCVWVDVIMIASAAVYVSLHLRELNSKL